MIIELHATEIELIKRMLKLTKTLKIEPRRYTIQLGDRITVYLKLYNPTVGEHNILIEHNGLLSKVIRNSQFSTTTEWQLYEFTYPDMKDN
jgi:hypothetical protein